jgi:hypothetical protein
MRSAMRLIGMIAFLWSLGLCTTAAPAEEDSENADSNSANNPVEPRLTVQYWNFYAPSLSDVNGGAENGIGRILIPFQVGGVQQVMHIDPPVVTDPTARSGPRTGLGDTQLYNFTLGSFDLGLPQKVTLGFGPLLALPTRSNGNFGTDKLQTGAGGVILAPQGWGILGMLATYQRKVSGPAAQVTSVQPQVFYNLSRGYYLRSSAIITFDGATQTAVVPVGFGFGKVIHLSGGFTLNLYAEGQPSLYRTGVGAPNYQVFTGVKLQFPSAVTSQWHFLTDRFGGTCSRVADTH